MSERLRATYSGRGAGNPRLYPVRRTWGWRRVKTRRQWVQEGRCSRIVLRLIGESADTKISQCPKQMVTALPAVLGTAEAARADLNGHPCRTPDSATNTTIRPCEPLTKSMLFL